MRHIRSFYLLLYELIEILDADELLDFLSRMIKSILCVGMRDLSLDCSDGVGKLFCDTFDFEIARYQVYPLCGDERPVVGLL